MDVSDSEYNSTVCINATINEIPNENVLVTEIATEEGTFIVSMDCETETVSATIEEDPALKVGSRFSDYQSFEDALSLYSLSNNLVYTTLKSSSINRRNKARREKNLKLFNPNLKIATLTMGCKHYGMKKSRAKGIRPKQSTYKTGCNSQITLALDTSTQTLVVTRFVTEHNHDVSQDVAENYPERRRLSMQETFALEERLRDPALKARQVQDLVRTTLHKNVSSKDVHNFRASLRRPRKKTPAIELVNEDEILKPGEALPYTPRTYKWPKAPRAKKAGSPRVAVKVLHSEPTIEYSESLEGDTELMEVLVEEQPPTSSEAVECEHVVIFNGNLSVKLEDADADADADADGSDQEHYECVEYLEPPYDEQERDPTAGQSVAAVNESWKCVYKLLEADNAALRRDVARLRAQLQQVEQRPCDKCGAIAAEGT